MRSLFVSIASPISHQVRVAKGEPQIFLPLGQGIAGHCAQSGMPVLVPDAYAGTCVMVVV